MNRRPQKSRSSYDAFSPPHTARFRVSSPDTRFFETRKRRSFLFSAFRGIALCLLLSVAFSFVSNLFVHVSRVSVPVTGLTEAFEGYTILHISDLKGASFGGGQSRLTMALGDAEFDAVLITGDMISPLGNAQPFYELIEALRTLRPSAPIYFISGDSDPEPVSMTYASGGSPFAPWVLGAQQRGAILLRSPESVTRGNQTLWFTTLAQLSLDLDTMQLQYEQSYLRALDSGDGNEIELATHNLQSLEFTRAARSTMKDEDVYISLTHVPPMQDELDGEAGHRVDLLLCGHYLGGLMRLPLLGPLFIPSQSLPLYGLFPGRDTHFGLTRIGHTQIYTSPGLCGSDAQYPPFFFRLFNPPTVTLLTLTPSSL